MSVADSRRGATPLSVVPGSVPIAAAPRRRDWKVVRLLVLNDVVALLLATMVAVAIVDPGDPIPPVGWAVFTVSLTIALFSTQRLYERDRRQISVSTLDEVRDVLTSLGLVGFATFAIALGFNQTWLLPPEPLSVVFFWLVGILLSRPVVLRSGSA